MDVHESSVIRRNPRVVFRELTGEAGGVLLNIDTAAYHGVDAVGALVWDAIGDESTVSAIVAVLRDRLDDVPDGVEHEIIAFVDELRERDLVVVADPGS